MSTVNEKMTALADAIREKAGRTDTLTLDEMATAVQGIETGTDTSDATATADEIFAGETAYTADGKVTGTFTIEDELTEQNDLISQISTLVATKANPPSGTSVEMCTGTLVIDAPTNDDFTVYAVSENLQVTTTVFEAMNGGTFQTAKGTVIAVTPWTSSGTASGGCTECFGTIAGGAFIVMDDFILTYSM